jgi:hypothetical protein
VSWGSSAALSAGRPGADLTYQKTVRDPAHGPETPGPAAELPLATRCNWYVEMGG